MSTARFAFAFLLLSLAFAGSAAAVTFTIELHGLTHHVQPTRITVVQGTEITFHVVATANNTGAHSFVLEDSDVNTGPLAPGTSADADYAATRAGSFAYYSDLANDRLQGMEGLLVVQAAPTTQTNGTPTIASAALLAVLALLALARPR